jgi:hypothetical protein
MKSIGLIFLAAFFASCLFVEACAQQSGEEKQKVNSQPPPPTIKTEADNLRNSPFGDSETPCFGDAIPSEKAYQTVTQEPKIGAKVSDYLKPAPNNSLGYSMKFNSIKYTVTTNTKGIINYISTTDSQFVSPEGIKIGDSLAKVREVSKKDLIKESRCVSYVPLKSGWKAAFGRAPVQSDGTSSPSLIVNRFFKKEQSKAKDDSSNGAN